MKRYAVFLAVAAISLTGLEGSAFAQGDGDIAAQQEATRQVNEQALRQARLRGYRNYAPTDPRYRDGRGFGDQRYYRGDRVPSEYRNRSYVVDDWQGHRLNAPPRGHHWIQVGGDYVLVENTTNVIRQFFPVR